MIPIEPPLATVGTFAYRDQLHPWCIIYLMPKMQRRVVSRFRRRSSAEEHLKVLQRLSPAFSYQIIFDPPQNL